MFRLFTYLLLCLFTATTQANPRYIQPNLAQQLIDEVNLARTQPIAYAEKLRWLKQHYQGRYLQQDDRLLLMAEGVAAVEEAIAFLQQVQPQSPLRPVPGLAWAAFDHVQDQGKQGGVGHIGADNSTLLQRVKRYGRWQGSVGENIRYGPNNAETIVMHWLINDGLTTRSHRHNIFEPSYQVTGVACGPHQHYQQMCVMTYAQAFTAY